MIQNDVPNHILRILSTHQQHPCQHKTVLYLC
jgi:hypothetical protein